MLFEQRNPTVGKMLQGVLLLATISLSATWTIPRPLTPIDFAPETSQQVLKSAFSADSQDFLTATRRLFSEPDDDGENSMTNVTGLSNHTEVDDTVVDDTEVDDTEETALSGEDVDDTEVDDKVVDDTEVDDTEETALSGEESDNADSSSDNDMLTEISSLFNTSAPNDMVESTATFSTSQFTTSVTAEVSSEPVVTSTPAPTTSMNFVTSFITTESTTPSAINTTDPIETSAPFMPSTTPGCATGEYSIEIRGVLTDVAREDLDEGVTDFRSAVAAVLEVSACQVELLDVGLGRPDTDSDTDSDNSGKDKSDKGKSDTDPDKSDSDSGNGRRLLASANTTLIVSLNITGLDANEVANVTRLLGLDDTESALLELLVNTTYFETLTSITFVEDQPGSDKDTDKDTDKSGSDKGSDSDEEMYKLNVTTVLTGVSVRDVDAATLDLLVEAVVEDLCDVELWQVEVLSFRRDAMVAFGTNATDIPCTTANLTIEWRIVGIEGEEEYAIVVEQVNSSAADLFEELADTEVEAFKCLSSVSVMPHPEMVVSDSGSDTSESDKSDKGSGKDTEDDDEDDMPDGDTCCDCERTSCNNGGGNGDCKESGAKDCGGFDCNAFCANANYTKAHVAVLLDYVSASSEGANIVASVNADPELTAHEFDNLEDWVKALKRFEVALLPEFNGDAATALGKDAKDVKKFVEKGGVLVSATDDFNKNHDFLNEVFGWSSSRYYWNAPTMSRQAGADGTCFSEANGSPATLDDPSSVTWTDNNDLPEGGVVLYSDGGRQIAAWRIAVKKGWVYVLAYDWSSGANADWDWMLQTSLTCEDEADSKSDKSDKDKPDEDEDAEDQDEDDTMAEGDRCCECGRNSCNNGGNGNCDDNEAEDCGDFDCNAFCSTEETGKDPDEETGKDVDKDEDDTEDKDDAEATGKDADKDEDDTEDKDEDDAEATGKDADKDEDDTEDKDEDDTAATGKDKETGKDATDKSDKSDTDSSSSSSDVQEMFMLNVTTVLTDVSVLDLDNATLDQLVEAVLDGLCHVELGQVEVLSVHGTEWKNSKTSCTTANVTIEWRIVGIEGEENFLDVLGQVNSSAADLLEELEDTELEAFECLTEVTVSVGSSLDTAKTDKDTVCGCRDTTTTTPTPTTTTTDISTSTTTTDISTSTTTPAPTSSSASSPTSSSSSSVHTTSSTTSPMTSTSEAMDVVTSVLTTTTTPAAINTTTELIETTAPFTTPPSTTPDCATGGFSVEIRGVLTNVTREELEEGAMEFRSAVAGVLEVSACQVELDVLEGGARRLLASADTTLIVRLNITGLDADEVAGITRLLGLNATESALLETLVDEGFDTLTSITLEAVLDEDEDEDDMSDGDKCCDCERTSCNNGGGNGNCKESGASGSETDDSCGDFDCNAFCANANYTKAHVAVLLDYVSASSEGANIVASVNAVPELTAHEFDNLEDWVKALKRFEVALLPEFNGNAATALGKDAKDVKKFVEKGGVLVSATDDFNKNHDFLNEVFGWSSSRYYWNAPTMSRQAGADGTCFSEANGSPATLDDPSSVIWTDNNDLPEGGVVLYSDGGRQIAAWRIAVKKGWVYVLAYDWSSGANADWDWMLQTSLTCEDEADPKEDTDSEDDDTTTTSSRVPTTSSTTTPAPTTTSSLLETQAVTTTMTNSSTRMEPIETSAPFSTSTTQPSPTTSTTSAVDTTSSTTTTESPTTAAPTTSAAPTTPAAPTTSAAPTAAPTTTAAPATAAPTTTLEVAVETTTAPMPVATSTGVVLNTSSTQVELVETTAPFQVPTTSAEIVPTTSAEIVMNTTAAMLTTEEMLTNATATTTMTVVATPDPLRQIFQVIVSSLLTGITRTEFEAGLQVFKDVVASLFPGRTGEDVIIDSINEVTVRRSDPFPRRRLLATAVEVNYRVVGFSSESEAADAGVVVQSSAAQMQSGLQASGQFNNLQSLEVTSVASGAVPVDTVGDTNAPPVPFVESPADDKGHWRDSPGFIAGLTVGVLSLLALIVAAFVVHRRRKFAHAFDAQINHFKATRKSMDGTNLEIGEDGEQTNGRRGSYVESQFVLGEGQQREGQMPRGSAGADVARTDLENVLLDVWDGETPGLPGRGISGIPGADGHTPAGRMIRNFLRPEVQEVEASLVHVTNGTGNTPEALPPPEYDGESRRGSVVSMASIPPTVAPTMIAPTVQPSVLSSSAQRTPSHPLLNPSTCLKMSEPSSFRSTMSGAPPAGSVARSADLVNLDHVQDLVFSELPAVPEVNARDNTSTLATAEARGRPAACGSVKHLMGSFQSSTPKGSTPQVLAVRPAPSSASLLATDMEEAEPPCSDIPFTNRGMSSDDLLGALQSPTHMATADILGALQTDPGESFEETPHLPPLQPNSLVMIPGLQDDETDVYRPPLNLDDLYGDGAPRLSQGEIGV